MQSVTRRLNYLQNEKRKSTEDTSFYKKFFLFYTLVFLSDSLRVHGFNLMYGEEFRVSQLGRTMEGFSLFLTQTSTL